jgi:hypothetical protein
VQSRILRDGDMIALGDTLLRFGEGALPRRRPAGPEQALQLARAGRSTADLEADPLRELAPRPIPRAWDSPGGTGLSDTSTGMNVPAPSPD